MNTKQKVLEQVIPRRSNRMMAIVLRKVRSIEI
jgi:hypothetical protein